MAKMKIWYDEEGDYLEFGIGNKKGFMKDIGNDIWERIENDQVVGIAILGFRKRLKGKIAELELPVSMAFSNECSLNLSPKYYSFFNLCQITTNGALYPKTWMARGDIIH